MCIIVVKEKGKDLPDRDILYKCWERNSSGAGIMYNLNGSVHIEKGFMVFDSLMQKINQLQLQYNIREMGLVIHFRIPTSGIVDKGNCHPYPLVDNKDLLRETDVVTDVGVAHNGIILRYNSKDDVLNDTQLFVIKDLYELYKMKNTFYKNEIIMTGIENSIDSSRIAIMDKHGNIYRVGTWINEEGIYFSNSSYKHKKSIMSNRANIDYTSIFKCEELNELYEEKYFINGEEVLENDFMLEIETMKKLDDTNIVYDTCGMTEYRGNRGDYYLDTLNKEIWEVTDGYELNYLGEYLTDSDLRSEWN